MNIIDEEKLNSSFPACGSRISILEEAVSTNTMLKGLAREGAPSGTVLIALRQTGGRGRLGHSFESPAGGIYFSYLMHPKTSPEETAEITMCTAVYVRRMIIDLTGIEPDIKYVNDLLYKGKKLCGILTELIEGNLIIGIGLNVNNSSNGFPDELKDIVVSLSDLCGHELDLNEFAFGLVSAIDKLAASWPECKEEALTQYKKYCINPEKMYKENGAV